MALPVYLPLAGLLGIRPGSKVSLISPPKDFIQRLEPLPEGAAFLEKAATGLDVILLFTADKVDLLERLPALCRAMAVTGGIWVLWPKPEQHPSRHPLSEEFIRLAALEAGLVDNKRFELDDTWTGLRLVWKPKRPRPNKPTASPLQA